MEKEVNHLSFKKTKRKSGKTLIPAPVNPLVKNPAVIITKSGQVKTKKKHKFGSKISGAVKKVGKATKATSGKVLKAVGKAGKGITKAAVKVAKAATLAPLVPLMPTMGAALRRKGLNPPKKIDARAELFYNTIVRKNTFDAPAMYFENGYDDDHLAADIVVSIIDFIKKSINRKKQGAQLDPVEQIVADGGEMATAKIEAELKAKGIDPAAVRTSGQEIAGDTNMKGALPDSTGAGDDKSIKGFTPKKLLIGGAVLAGAYLLLKK